MDNKYKIFVDEVFLKDPTQTEEIMLGDLSSKSILFSDNRDKNKILRAKILLTIITVFIIVPITLFPPIGTIYLANVYESFTLGNTVSLVAIVSGIWGYILFLWIKLQFFEILN